MTLGPGHSSLALFKYCDIDTLKIDRGFVSGLSNDTSTSIVEAVIALAKVLRVRTVAEGVEQQHELDMLQKIGCSQVQGFLLAKPMPADQFARLLGTQQEPVPVNQSREANP